MAEQGDATIEPALSFDRFAILPRRRLLLEAGKPVRLGSRAFDILLALTERPGERIGKAELLARVWPGTHVVESNLKFQVATLRKALRDGQDGRRFIETSQGQGYCFVAPVAVIETREHPSALAGATAPPELSEALTPLIGRDGDIARLVKRLALHRLLTIVGSGGIGKTALALAVAEQVKADYADGARVVDFGRILDPGLVLGALAAAIGVEAGPGLTTPDLVAALRERRMLLVLDDCMHVVDEVAALGSAILRGAPQLRILATSREPLRIQGEHLCRLEPLDVPPSPDIGAAEAMRYAAVQLFVQRAGASLDEFRLTDAEAPCVIEICRKLDGIPLAIELAAARVGVLGLGALASQLEDRLRLLTGGRRTALPRHRTMRAALDWSYDLLSAPERVVFRRLAVFVGGFTLAAAADVAADETLSGEEVVELILELATKSLLLGETDSLQPRFRMLETTRAYALDLAREGGELAALAARHAAHFLVFLRGASQEGMAEDQVHAAILTDLGNLRAALSWALGPGGEPATGVAITVASLPLWLATSRVGEAHGWTERAIACLDQAGLRGTRQEMALQAALGISLQMARGRTEEAEAALRRALALARQLGEAGQELQILHTLWIYHLRTGRVRAALDLARRAEALAASLADPGAARTAAWMLGIALHFSGEHHAARRLLQELLGEPRPGARARQIGRAGFDQDIAARFILAHVLWVQGCPDDAAEALHVALEEARRLGHPITLCSTLAWGACAFHLRAGDLDAAWHSATELVQEAEKHALSDHLSYGQATLAVIALRRAGAAAGIALARSAVERWRAAQWHVALGVADFAEAAASAGLGPEMAALVDEALQRAERERSLANHPEILRVKGEILLLQDPPDTAGARQCFAESLAEARAHGALAWELRSAVSLYRFALRNGGAQDASNALAQACGRFGGADDTAELRDAGRLLAEHGQRRRH